MSFNLIIAYCLMVLSSIGTMLVMRIYSKKILCLSAVLHSFERPVLYYDEKGQLQVATRGLVYFDRAALRTIDKAPVKPTGSQTLVGELVIDSNRYRYRAKLLEYKPGLAGTVIYLEYQGSVAAR